MDRRLLGGRLLLSGRTALLAIGDLLAIVTFVAIGEARHGGTLAAGAETTGQFLLGWVVASLLVGAYAPRALASVTDGVGRAVGAWLMAAVLGVSIRAALTTGRFSVVFLLVSIGVGGVLLALWRVLALRFVAD